MLAQAAPTAIEVRLGRRQPGKRVYVKSAQVIENLNERRAGWVPRRRIYFEPDVLPFIVIIDPRDIKRLAEHGAEISVIGDALRFADFAILRDVRRREILPLLTSGLGESRRIRGERCCNSGHRYDCVHLEAHSESLPKRGVKEGAAFLYGCRRHANDLQINTLSLTFEGTVRSSSAAQRQR
jgi:hypothetical protein